MAWCRRHREAWFPIEGDGCWRCAEERAWLTREHRRLVRGEVKYEDEDTRFTPTLAVVAQD